MAAVNFKSTVDHEEVVSSISAVKEEFYQFDQERIPLLRRQRHIEYLRGHLRNNLASAYTSLDASFPWICYWICHSLSLLGHTLTKDEKQRVFNTLKECRCCTEEMDGFSGNPTVKVVHLASTYAAISTLCILADGDSNAAEYFSILDVERLKTTLFRLKDPKTGAFSMHIDGEQDTRAVYCALIIADVYGILVEPNAHGERILDRVADYVSSCQNYDGGLGPQPRVESHGGYTYCGLASLALLNGLNRINTLAAVEWCCKRQLFDCGCGFQGRTNKLVDGCYSFWLGASLWILGVKCGHLLPESSTVLQPDIDDQTHFSASSQQHVKDRLLFDQCGLQEFVLIYCQSNEDDSDDEGVPVKSLSDGGLCDKPGELPDLYHTCYCLSGLAIAQCAGFVCGTADNLLNYTAAYTTEELFFLNPIYNVNNQFVTRAKAIISSRRHI